RKRACTAIAFCIRPRLSYSLISPLRSPTRRFQRGCATTRARIFLIIDEFGFDKIERAECPEGGTPALQDHRFTKSEALHGLVTNVDFDKWRDYLSDGTLAMAFLD